MSKVNATLINIIMVIMTGVMGICGYFIPGRTLGLSIGILGAVLVAVIAFFVLKKADINERGYYIFGSHTKDMIVCAGEFILVTGLMAYLGISGSLSATVCAWETVMIFAFCGMLFYGIEKKKLRDDIIAEIEEEQRRQMAEEEESEK